MLCYRVFLFVGLCLLVTAHERVRLQEVTAITLKQGEFTTARRVASLPQLHCIAGGVGCEGDYAVPSVQCRNVGWDGIDVNWSCTTDLPKGISFGLAEVNCEGYEYPEDPFVLAGSCQLRYNLQRKSAGGGAKQGSLASFCAAAAVTWLLFRSCHSSTTGRIPTAQPVAGPGFFTGLAVGALGAGAHRRRVRWGGTRRGGNRHTSNTRRKATAYARTTRR